MPREDLLDRAPNSARTGAAPRSPPRSRPASCRPSWTARCSAPPCAPPRSRPGRRVLARVASHPGPVPRTTSSRRDNSPDSAASPSPANSTSSSVWADAGKSASTVERKAASPGPARLACGPSTRPRGGSSSTMCCTASSASSSEGNAQTPQHPRAGLRDSFSLILRKKARVPSEPTSSSAGDARDAAAGADCTRPRDGGPSARGFPVPPPLAPRFGPPYPPDQPRTPAGVPVKLRHPPVRQRRLDRQHVVGHDSIGDGARPAAVVARHPRMVARLAVATSTGEEETRGSQPSFSRSSTTPGSTRTVRASRSTGPTRRRYRDVSTTSARPIACPHCEVPAPRAAPAPLLPRDRHGGVDVVERARQHHPDRLDLVDGGVGRVEASGERVEADRSFHVFAQPGGQGGKHMANVNNPWGPQANLETRRHRGTMSQTALGFVGMHSETVLMARGRNPAPAPRAIGDPPGLSGTARGGCGLLGGCGGGTRADEARELSFGHVGAPGSLFALTAEEFARRVNERLNGEAEVVVYGSSQLGGDDVLLQSSSWGPSTWRCPRRSCRRGSRSSDSSRCPTWSRTANTWPHRGGNRVAHAGAARRAEGYRIWRCGRTGIGT